MKKIIIFIIVIALLCVLGFYWFPIQFAVDVRYSDQQMIYVTTQKVTGFDWKMLRNERQADEDIFMLGELPTNTLKRKVIVGHNIFRCQGYWGDEKEFDGSKYRTFVVEKWDIVGPIKRGDTLLPNCLYPESYLTLADFILK